MCERNGIDQGVCAVLYCTVRAAWVGGACMCERNGIDQGVCAVLCGFGLFCVHWLISWMGACRHRPGCVCAVLCGLGLFCVH